MSTVSFRPGPQHGEVARFLHDSWGEIAALHDRHWRLADLDAFVAEQDGVVTGVVTVELRGDLLEIVTCDARPPSRGTGGQLLAAAVPHAQLRGARAVRVTTTNDNLPALGFYQAHGFRIVGVWPDAVAQARRVKPSIPAGGHRGLPIRDEIDLELPIS